MMYCAFSWSATCECDFYALIQSYPVDNLKLNKNDRIAISLSFQVDLGPLNLLPDISVKKAIVNTRLMQVRFVTYSRYSEDVLARTAVS